MKHFGIAFGVIVATAVGGAFVYDRTIDSRPAHTAIVTQPKTPGPALSARTNGASETPSIPAASTAIVTEETQSRATLRTPPAQIASVSKATKSSTKTVTAAPSRASTSRAGPSTEGSSMSKPSQMDSAPPAASPPPQSTAPAPAEPAATPAATSSTNETT